MRGGKRRKDHWDSERTAGLDQVPNRRDPPCCFGYPVGRPTWFDEFVLHINDQQSAALSCNLKCCFAGFVRSPGKFEDFILRIHSTGKIQSRSCVRTTPSGGSIQRSTASTNAFVYGCSPCQSKAASLCHFDWI